MVKFGKRLQSQIEETLPEWRDKFLSYKPLKKRLKLIAERDRAAALDNSGPPVVAPPPSDRRVEGIQSHSHSHSHSSSDSHSSSSSVNDGGAGLAEHGHQSSRSSESSSSVHDPVGIAGIDLKNLTAEEVDFIQLLNIELEKLNNFFIEKEEEYVIRLQELKERIERLKGKTGLDVQPPPKSELSEELIKIQKDFVKFHGEMVLLENYSAVNYTGLAKILKKHDKLTGALLRMPFIQNVLRQPFFTTELLSKLVQECEVNLGSLFPAPASTSAGDMSARGGEGGDQQEVPLFEGEEVENIYRGTVAALRTIKELRKGSSTVSMFSLPPLGQNENTVDSRNAQLPSCCPSIIPICPKS